jgi:hypothetical protein
MRTHRNLLAAIALLAATGYAFEVRAEVAAETDVSGNYLRTAIVAGASTKRLKIWSVTRLRPLSYALNPGGDVNGDLWPLVAENPHDANRPWVVWSRYTGAGYDLAWARWLQTGWTRPAWVEEPGEAAHGDDLDPRVAFASTGRPYLVWWRNEGGIGRVYLSIFLESRWMAAYPVSSEGVDSRSPGIVLLDDGRMQIDYDTPAGHVVDFVTLNRPLSITDDIDPMARINGGASGSTVPPAGSSY